MHARIHPPTTRTPPSRDSLCSLALFLVLLFSGAVHAATWHVDAARADDNGDGLGWDTAKKSIQAAVTEAAEGDLVLVADGVYAPFVAGAVAVTVRSVNGAEHTIVDGNGIERCATLGTDLVAGNTVLDGFTLQNGHAENGGGAAYGILTNCRLTGNAADYGGGAYDCTLTNCSLDGNSAEFDGGGAYTCTLIDCALTANNAEIGGGASQSDLSNCTLTENTAEGWVLFDEWNLGQGGGASDSTLANCTVTGNAAVVGGGAFNCTLTACALTNNSAVASGGGAFDCTLDICVLTGNSATGEDGGGAYDCTLANCLVARNDAAKGGGGTYGSALANCTVAGNSAFLGGGGVYDSQLRNCIAWGNDADADANYYNSMFAFSCSEPLPDGAGNISANPLFIDAADGDYRLHANSPCLNKGDNASSPGAADLAGNPRISHGIVDMGAYETSIFANLAIAPDTGAPGDFITRLANGENLTISGILREALLTVAVAKGETVLGQKTCAGDDQAFDLAFPLAEGAHDLTITVTDQAGNSAAAEQTVVIDNTALDYNWQNGWNTLYLPFDSIIPETAEALSALPRFSLDANSYVMTTTPLHSVMWVFCPDRTQAPALRGNRKDDPPPDLDKLPAGQWSFIGFGSQSDMDLPDETMAWEWQAGKYVLAQIMRPGHVYCFYREP